jgi:hypothetical protein
METVAVPLRETASGRRAEDFDDHELLVFAGARHARSAHAKSQFHISKSGAQTATAADECIDRRAGVSRYP